VHIGAGKIGLGLVGDVSTRLGFDLVLLNRTNPSDPVHAALQSSKRYEIRYTGLGARTRTVENFEYHFYPSADRDLRGEDPAVMAIADPGTRLITIAVEDKYLTSISPLLAAGLNQRVSSGRDPGIVFVVACQNTPRASAIVEEDVRRVLRRSRGDGGDDALDRWAVFCNAVIDRICSKCDVVNGSVVVRAEDYLEWVVQLPQLYPDVLQALLHEHVTMVTADQYEVYEKKKFWGMNAIHLGTAVYAREKGLSLLADAIGNGEIQKRIRLLQKEMAFAIHDFSEGKFTDERFSLDNIEHFSQLVYSRIEASEEDTVHRIIGELMALKEIDKRIADVVEALRQRNATATAIDIAEVLGVADVSTFLGKVNLRLCEPIRLLIARELPYNSGLDLLLSVFAFIEWAFNAYRGTLATVRGAGK